MVQDDVNKLVAAAATCEDFADKRIAHRDKRTPAALPKFKQADQAVDTMHDLCLKYRRILLADCLTTLLPTYQYDWQQVFDYPWRKPDSTLPSERIEIDERTG